jgi:hypothetical protein
MSERKRDRSCQARLQRLLGDLGWVLPRQEHGTPERPAQGWYAQLDTGKLVFLGDYTLLAALKIRKLHEARDAQLRPAV